MTVHVLLCIDFEQEVRSPISMSHYTKNVQSLLTGDFKVLNVIFKSKFRVKDNTKEL